MRAVDGVNDSISFEVREATSLSVDGPEQAAAGEEIYVAAELRDAEGRPLYASSSVSWRVVEGEATLPDADDDGRLTGAFALVRLDGAGRIVVQADAIGFSSSIVIEPAAE